MTRLMMLATVLGALFARAEVRVASMDLNTRGVKAQLGSVYAERFALQLRKQGLTVTTSKDVATVLSLERQRQLLGCSEASSSCLAELVGALGVDVLVTGSLVKVGRATQLSLKLVNSRSAATLYQVSKLVKDDEEVLDVLEASAPDAAAAVKAAFDARPTPVTPPAPPAVVEAPAPVAPRVVTIVQTQPAGPWLLGGAGALAVGSGGALLLASVLMVPTSPTANVTPSAQSALLAQAKQFQLVGAVTASVGAAAIVAAILWGRLGVPAPVAPVLTSDGRGASLGLAGQW